MKRNDVKIMCQMCIRTFVENNLLSLLEKKYEIIVQPRLQCSSGTKILILSLLKVRPDTDCPIKKQNVRQSYEFVAYFVWYCWGNYINLCKHSHQYKPPSNVWYTRKY